MQSDSNYTHTGKRNANTSSSISTGRIIFFILFNIFYIWGQGGGPVLLIQADFPCFLFCFVLFFSHLGYTPFFGFHIFPRG